jgi:methylthioribose-1-phosphate isomerase
MPTDRSLITVSDLVRQAAAIVDPQGEDPAVVELADRHGDDDEPVRGVLESLEERLAWGAEFDGTPPENVTAWLEEQGVELT